jgi:hypothetical protein
MLTQFSLSATSQPLATFAMTFENSPQTPWDKRTRASWLLMERNLVFKKVSLVFDSLTTQAHSIFSSWTTAYNIQPLRWIIFQRDILQRNSLMQMAIQTRRLASNLDNQLMFLPGLSSSSRRLPIQVSGLPELLFDEGFWMYKSFCMQAWSSCANAITDLTPNEIRPSNVIPLDSQDLSSSSFDESEDDDDTIDMLFMLNENVILKDCKGITQEVTYLGPQYSGETLQHKVWTRNEHDILVDGTLLSSTDAPDISTIPVCIEKYATEIPKLTQEQIQSISHPQILDDDQKEFTGLHCKMNHLHLSAMITLAEKGWLNRKFIKLKYRLPVCMSCIFITAHCKPWHSKGAKGSIQKEEEDAPGKCVSINHMISAQPGLIPQMAGFLTNLRIWAVSIFVDHYLDYVYVALMRDLTLDESLLTKSSFKRHANEGGVTISSYCTDDGWFADSGFQQAVKDSNQKITYCAVGAHHQNGIVKRRIKELTLISW